MPYSSDSEVPSYVPKAKRKQWRSVWNSVYNQTGDESRAFASANSVAGPKSKKLFKFGTELTGYTHGFYGPFECGHCLFFDAIDKTKAFCGNEEVKQDPGVPSDQYGNKVVNFIDCCNNYFPVNLSKGLVMLEKAKNSDKPLDEVKLFCPLVKVDAKKREVWGVVTAEVVDRDNEICDYDSTVPYYKAIVDEMSKASDGMNIMPLRAMHGLIAAGKGIGIEFRDESKQVFMGFKVVDDVEWKKVEEAVYTGFSQGGRYIKKWADGEYTRYTAKPSEVSLVDIPCLATATFEYVKTDGTSEMRKFKKTETLGQKEGEISSTNQKEKPVDGDMQSTYPCNCDCKACKAGDHADCSATVKCGTVKSVTLKELLNTLTKKEKKKAGVKYLVTDSEGNGYLPYTRGDGKPNHNLMGAAWAALFSPGGHRGNKYEGPDKEKAKSKLKGLYRQEGLDTPNQKALEDAIKSEERTNLLKNWTVEAINSRAYGQLGKGMYTVGRFAEIVESLKYLWLAIEYEEEMEEVEGEEGDGDEATDEIFLEGLRESYLRLLDSLLAYTEDQVEEAKAHPQLAEAGD